MFWVGLLLGMMLVVDYRRQDPAFLKSVPSMSLVDWCLGDRLVSSVCTAEM